MICDEKLKLFCLNNPDLKQTILSFYFGEANSKNALIYNILYSKKTFSSLSQNFQNIHKTQWLCYLILNVYPMYFQYVPKHIRTYPMSLKAILSFPENIKYVTFGNQFMCIYIFSDTYLICCPVVGVWNWTVGTGMARNLLYITVSP